MNSVSQINVLKILVDIMQNPIWSIVMMYIQSPPYFRKVKKKKKKKKKKKIYIVVEWLGSIVQRIQIVRIRIVLVEDALIFIMSLLMLM